MKVVDHDNRDLFSHRLVHTRQTTSSAGQIVRQDSILQADLLALITRQSKSGLVARG